MVLGLANYVEMRKYIAEKVDGHWSDDTAFAIAEAKLRRLTREHNSIESIWAELKAEQ